METDIPLKVLARRHPQDLLRLVGDPGIAVKAQVLELQEIRRTVDCVIEVRDRGEVHFRHFEFQTAPDPDMTRRCFRYNSQLALQLTAPVITSVIYVLPPGPPGDELVFRMVVRGREVNAWRFDIVRLWEFDASQALASGAPGLLALVPLMRGGRTPRASLKADQRSPAPLQDAPVTMPRPYCSCSRAIVTMSMILPVW